jgi:hypothetical protein
MSTGTRDDWISSYRHGHDGEAENPWSFIFLSYLWEDPKAIQNQKKKTRRREMGNYGKLSFWELRSPLALS